MPGVPTSTNVNGNLSTQTPVQEAAYICQVPPKHIVSDGRPRFPCFVYEAMDQLYRGDRECFSGLPPPPSR